MTKNFSPYTYFITDFLKNQGPISEGVENVQNIKKSTTLYSRRTQYVHKPLPFDSPPQRLVSDLTCLTDAGEGKDVCRRGRPPPPAKEPPSPSRLTLKNERDSELGEGRVRVS